MLPGRERQKPQGTEREKGNLRFTFLPRPQCGNILSLPQRTRAVSDPLRSRPRLGETFGEKGSIPWAPPLTIPQQQPGTRQGPLPHWETRGTETLHIAHVALHSPTHGMDSWSRKGRPSGKNFRANEGSELKPSK